MAEQREKSIVRQQQDAPAEAETGHNVDDFGDLHEELRILLQGTQVLAAFLILLPFNQGFRQIDQSEKWLYLATFVCSIISLVLLSAPAAQHRLQRPLADRVAFKIYATRMAIAGLAFFFAVADAGDVSGRQRSRRTADGSDCGGRGGCLDSAELVAEGV